VLDGTWQSQNIWWGLKEGMVEIAPFGPSVPPEVATAASTVRDEIIAGALHPFTGPIMDQAGTERVGAGLTIPDADLLKRVADREGLLMRSDALPFVEAGHWHDQAARCVCVAEGWLLGNGLGAGVDHAVPDLLVLRPVGYEPSGVLFGHAVARVRTAIHCAVPDRVAYDQHDAGHVRRFRFRPGFGGRSPPIIPDPCRLGETVLALGLDQLADNKEGAHDVLLGIMPREGGGDDLPPAGHAITEQLQNGRRGAGDHSVGVGGRSVTVRHAGPAATVATVARWNMDKAR
jgi:hypothetical protein